MRYGGAGAALRFERSAGMETLVKNKVIKRNGEEVTFDLSKIVNAINAANKEVDNIYKMN